jgi:hypothetical protein
MLVSGCAFGTRHPTLVYPPDDYPVGSPGYVAPARAEPDRRPRTASVKVVLKPFADVRADTRLVGTVRNGYGMRTADVVPGNSVPDWVTEAVRKELRDGGYAVASDETAGDESSYVVSGDILDVFCDMYLDFSGRVSLAIRVRKAGNEVLNHQYHGEGNAGIVVAAASKSFAQSLALALASAVRQFVADLDRTLTTP